MNNGKKTKIVATIGPATESFENLLSLVNAGMNVMRLNFSHGDFKEHQFRVNNIKKVEKETGKYIAVLQDLGGPKIRIGEFKEGKVTLKEGATFTLATQQIDGTDQKVFINYPTLPKEVKKGGFILLHDGKLKLQITDIKKNEVITKVIVGGEIKGKRGVNLPGARLTISSVTDKDKADLKFGIENKVDYIALSFVRSKSDVVYLRELLKKAKSNAQIISKIETAEAIENIDEIIEVSDGLMVARGDLAIEIPAEEVPLIQKTIIKKCNALGKPVITATQMLESMINSPVPTRAEVSDIANAIIDGTDAIMLSEETTLGKYPLPAVQMMTRIAKEVEANYYTNDKIAQYKDSHGITDVVSESAVRTCHDLEAKCIVALTKTGRTGRMIARYKPCERIIALTLTDEAARKLALSFGCYPIVVKEFKTLEEVMEIVREVLIKEDIAEKGNKVVILAGLPFGKVKETNMVLVETI